MKIGFAKTDITPRVGVELAGFGPYLNRHSIGVRDRLWARAMAVNSGKKNVLLIACDLVGITPRIRDAVRRLAREKTGTEENAVMICCTHTHSGPGTSGSVGWGAADPPYLELLPYRIALACKKAVEDMEEAAIGYSEAPCEGIGLNRVYDEDAPPLDEVLEDGWRPAKPELTDTACRVITVKCGSKLKGFVSYFGCHPVVCCASTRYIHGDYAGIATNSLERENPGSVGMFLQGASGDVNSCVVHKPELESLLALDIIAARFANSVRKGIEESRTVKADTASSITREVHFARNNPDLPALEKDLAERRNLLAQDGASDRDRNIRMAVLEIRALEKFIGKLRSGRGEELDPAIELQCLGIGPITLFGAPFEVFQGIKNDLEKQSQSDMPLLVSHANGSNGYAPDRNKIGAGEYADKIVPIIKQYLPYSDIHNELVDHFIALESAPGR